MFFVFNDDDDFVNGSLKHSYGETSVHGHQRTRVISSLTALTAPEVYSFRAGWRDWKTGVLYFFRRTKSSAGYTWRTYSMVWTATSTEGLSGRFGVSGLAWRRTKLSNGMYSLWTGKLNDIRSREGQTYDCTSKTCSPTCSSDSESTADSRDYKNSTLSIICTHNLKSTTNLCHVQSDGYAVYMSGHNLSSSIQ